MANFLSALITAADAGALLSTLQVSGGGRLWTRHVRHVQAGAAAQNDTIDLLYLPSGRNFIIGKLSHISLPAQTNGSATVGHPGWTKPDATTVAASANAFLTATTHTSAVISALTVLGAEYDSRAVIPLRLTAAGTGGLADAAIVEAFIVGIAL